ncbi:MAG: DUF3847 domain-containing protein [Butyrivibrio sp.]|nr:DUF3847 domain-containing protein [Butyrivibrio sp.]MBQ6407953.1 DUF3847 domain-containing protein [Butyrivibrio sp.]
MASKKSYNERIDDIQTKIEQLKAQEKALKQKRSADERKQRTKRLIEIGGAVESVLKKSLGEYDGLIEKEDIPTLISYLQGQEDRGQYFSKAITRGREERKNTTPEPEYTTEDYSSDETTTESYL